jgi:hypothetical protein
MYQVRVQVTGDVTLDATVKVDAEHTYFGGTTIADLVPDAAERGEVIKFLKATARNWYTANVPRTQGG